MPFSVFKSCHNSSFEIFRDNFYGFKNGECVYQIHKHFKNNASIVNYLDTNLHCVRIDTQKKFALIFPSPRLFYEKSPPITIEIYDKKTS
jgi:hypothetical protein